MSISSSSPVSLLLISASLLVACSVSCSKPREAPDALSVPGVLTIDVIEGGRPEHYRAYRVEPSRASIELTKQEEIRDPYHNDIPERHLPAGAFQFCGKSVSAKSSDGNEVASCVVRGNAEELVISDASGKEVDHWTKQGRAVRGFAWSPDSRSIAVLNVSTRLGKKPIEVLSAISGHPVPHDTVFLQFIQRDGKVSEYVICQDVVSSFTRILQWQ